MAEKLNINKNPETLFVGVGGVGSEIVVRVAERCAKGETRNIRFVVMDTDANALSDVKNTDANISFVQTSSTRTVLDYLRNDSDAQANWFPNNTTLYPKTVSNGAGQVRAISRLALNATIKTGNIRPLYKTIDDLFLKDGGDLKQALRVVVVSSASGGTGSGIAMIVGMLIREYLHNHYREKAAVIRSLLLLPGVMDTVIPSASEQESQRRNGYATIKEINAFMIKASGFCGARKDLERFKDLHIDVPTTTGGVQRLEGLPFDFCFLLDRVDNNQESMQTLDQYKEFAAQSLYEQNIGPMQRKAFSMEDNIIKEFANKDNLGRNRFGGIGASVIRYPYEDIADYVAYARAMDRLGDGQGSVGEWLKYDMEYKTRISEYKKNRSMTTEKEPTIDNVYITTVNNGDDRFDNDVKGYLATDVASIETEIEDTLVNYLSNFDSNIADVFYAIPEVSSCRDSMNNYRFPLRYKGEGNVKGSTGEILSAIRNYQECVRNYAQNTAKLRAKAILYTAPLVASDRVQEYHLEYLLKTARGAMHPNAIRYMLYALRKKVQEEYDTLDLDLQSKERELKETYSANATKDLGIGDFTTLDALCEAEASSSKRLIRDGVSEKLQKYTKVVNEYCSLSLRYSSYKVILEYLSSICSEFERFYAGFEAKVGSLVKKKEELIEKLKFRKGDSISYVCATEKHLDRLVQMCPEGSDGLLLPEELNARIFDTVKKNAESDRMAQYDPFGDNSRVDIFDKALLDYFRTSVREECAEILDMNIIRALLLEQKLNADFEANDLLPAGASRVSVEISEDAKTKYLIEALQRGNRLASPGVGFATFSESRTVAACSFNEDLLKMRDVNVKVLAESLQYQHVFTDTVSRYDIRSFCALYNVTPDMLSRFRSPIECVEDDNYSEDAGLYYNAYHEHMEKIGPDSTKSSTITLHTDKRWDSITEMPEVSLSAHNEQMVKIHSALIRGVIYNFIQRRCFSRYDKQKKIYTLKDDMGAYKTFVVSNKTECDEFYEVLDALYRDNASVAEIERLACARCAGDVDANSRYDETRFVRDVEKFTVADIHPAPTSVFEIPLVYANSLPKAKSDSNEIAVMIDSVIGVLDKEISRYEQDVDKEPKLAERLIYQFKRLVENYNKYEELQKNVAASENLVLDMILIRVCNKLKELNTYNCNDIISELRALVHGE